MLHLQLTSDQLSETRPITVATTAPFDHTIIHPHGCLCNHGGLLPLKLTWYQRTQSID